MDGIQRPSENVAQVETEEQRQRDESTAGARRQAVVSWSKRAVHQAWRSKAIRIVGIVVLLVAVFVTTQRAFIAEQIASYVTDSRSPEIPAEWLVDAGVLRQAAEESRGTHNSDGEIHHTVDYPY